MSTESTGTQSINNMEKGEKHEPATPLTAEQIEANIARSREELAATVSEIAERLDPSARVKDKADQARATAAAFAEAASTSANDAAGKLGTLYAQAKSGDMHACAILAGVGIGAICIGSILVRWARRR